MKLSSEQSFYKKILKQKLFKNLYVLLFCLIFLSYPFSVNANEDLIMNPKTKIERNLASKYCQSIDKRLFEGLDNELILKYEYFVSSIPRNSIKNVNQFIDNFVNEVYFICSIKLTERDIEEFNIFFEKFYLEKNK